MRESTICFLAGAARFGGWLLNLPPNRHVIWFSATCVSHGNGDGFPGLFESKGDSYTHMRRGRRKMKGKTAQGAFLIQSGKYLGRERMKDA